MKQQRQLLALVALLVVAAGLWYFLYFRKDGAAPGTSNVAAARKNDLMAIDNPELHWPELARAQKTEYQVGRNIFSKEAAPPPQTVAENRKQLPLDIGPKPKPPDPPLVLPPNLKFFGYGTVPNGTARRAFFSDGEDVIIVAEGETLLGRYRIVKVNNTSLEFEELSTGRRNTAPLVEDQQAALPST
jgi:hypothetical protein